MASLPKFPGDDSAPRFTLEQTPKGMWAVRDWHEGVRIYITPRRDYAEAELAKVLGGAA